VSRLTPLPWRRIRCVFERDGWVFTKRTAGSHWCGEKPGCARPLILPAYDEVRLPIIMGLLRTAGMSRERFLELLEKC
jgi:hypothetical protein